MYYIYIDTASINCYTASAEPFPDWRTMQIVLLSQNIEHVFKFSTGNLNLQIKINI